MNGLRFLILLSLSPLATGLLSCRGSQLKVSCQTDSDCGPHFRCGVGGQFHGSCLCADDQACAPNDAGPTFCDPLGLCQGKVGCSTDFDCASGQFCDVSVGLCLASPACGTDLDCPFGTVCDSTTQLCLAGCRSTGDCPSGDGGTIVPCVCGDGLECQCPPPGDGGFIDPATYDRSKCPIGSCEPGNCAGDTADCPYNDSCVAPEADGGSWSCQPDPRDVVLCQGCTYTPGTVSACGAGNTGGANFCLLDLENPTGGTTFCGVDCSHGESCPSGYECDDVIILTQNPCSSDQSCNPSQIACDPELDGGGSCPVDTRCAPESASTGHCGGYCIMAEGEAGGFCSCVTDSDCPHDTCDTTSRSCTISQQPCDPSNPATCNAVVSCVDFGGARGCWIGRNCAPTHGLHCPLPANQ